MKRWKILLIIIIIIIILALLGYLICNNFQKSQKSSQTTPTDSAKITTPSPTATKTSEWEECAELSAADQETIASWETYTNDTYNYRFSYPSSWTISDDDLMQVTAQGEDSGEEIEFQVRVDRMTEIGFAGYNLVFTRDFTVNCIDAVENTYDGEDNLTLMTYRFDKSDIPYLLMFSFKDIGASYAGDIYDLGKLILKTFAFRE